MKRLIIAGVIFVLTTTLCITGFFAVEIRGEQMVEIIADGIDEAKSDSANLDEIAEKINKEWSKRSTLFKSVFIHDEFSEVEALLGKLTVFAEQRSCDDFIECCNEAISRLCCALDDEKPKIRNIF